MISGVAFAQETTDAGEAPAMEIESFDSTIESFEPVDAGAPIANVESFETPKTWQPSVHAYGWTQLYGSVDTRFDSPRGSAMAENVGEVRWRAWLGLDVKLLDWVRVVVEGRFQARGTAQRDGDRLKGFFEPMLGDAYVDLYTRYVDIRIGNQRIPLGANVGFAPADALNARDFRETVGEPEDFVIPVFAIRAQGDVGPISWLAAYVPFFTPNRFFLFGQDESVLQPVFARSLDNTRIDPSIEDYVQDHLMETKRPAPFVGDVALRAKYQGRVNIGASWVWMNEKTSQVTMDPELQRAFTSQAAAVSVLNRAQAGETLYTGRYLRQHLFSLEGSALLGPGQLDVDASYTPRQTFYDQSFKPVNKQAVTWVASYSQASDSPFFFAVSYMGMAIPDIGAKEQLVIIEPATARGAPHTAFFHLFSAALAYSFLDKRFEVSVRGSFEPIQRSFSISPRFTWAAVDGLKVFVMGEIYEGSAWSAFGYFNRNDRVILGARYELF